MCLASDASDFTFEILPDAEDTEFFAHFLRNGGFLSDTAGSRHAKEHFRHLAFHLHLEPGETAKRRLVAAWSFPYCAGKSGQKRRKELLLPLFFESFRLCFLLLYAF